MTNVARTNNTDTIASLLKGAEISERGAPSSHRFVVRASNYLGAPTFSRTEYAAAANAVNAINDFAGSDADVDYAVAALAGQMRARARHANANIISAVSRLTDALLKAATR